MARASENRLMAQQIVVESQAWHVSWVGCVVCFVLGEVLAEALKTVLDNVEVAIVFCYKACRRRR